MPSDNQRVAADEIAKHLLRHALQSVAHPELKQNCSQHYLDEMQLLSLFCVDYALGRKAAKLPAFGTVRELYNEKIEQLCANKEAPFTHRTVTERFEIYCEACNANTLAPKEYEKKPLVFWELGKAISRLASDVDPWVPDVLEVTLHTNIFLREVKGLLEFLAQYEVLP